MTPLNLALLDSDDRQRLALKRVLMQHGFTVADAASLPDLYGHIDRHYANALTTGVSPLLVLLRGVTFSSEFTDKILPSMRRAYPMVIAIQCPEDTQLRVLLFDRGADLCLSDRCGAEELSANLLAQARRLPDRWLATPTQSPPFGGNSAAPGLTSAHAMNDHITPYHVHAPDPLGHLAPGLPPTHLIGQGMPDLRMMEATAELQRKVYGTWALAHEDWILVNPLGTHIGLTGVERRCIAQVADNERREFPRHLAGEGGRGSFKSMSVVVSRMRKKVNRAGVPLPLHTVHGMGYVFIGTLMRKPSA